MRLWFLLAILAGAGAVAVLLGDDLSIASPDGGRLVSIAAAVALLIAFAGSVLASYSGRFGTAARDFAIWMSLGLALVVGYSYRDEFQSIAQRVTGELLPGEASTVTTSNAGERAVRIRRRSDGHFVARVAVERANLSMLVDTGASTVVLTPADARAAGVNLETLSYSVPVRTANGTAYAAAVRLKRLSVGGISVDGVDAMVAKPGALNESLLGMSFLRRLRSYEFSGDFLTLRI